MTSLHLESRWQRLLKVLNRPLIGRSTQCNFVAAWIRRRRCEAGWRRRPRFAWTLKMRDRKYRTGNWRAKRGDFSVHLLYPS